MLHAKSKKFLASPKKKLEIQAEVNRKQEAEDQAKRQAELDLVPILDAIAAADTKRRDDAHAAELARKAAEKEQEIAHKKELVDIEAAKQAAYANTVKLDRNYESLCNRYR